MAERVTICEVAPRDGLQIARGRMPTAVKSRWIAAMAAAGLPQIEVGSFVSPKLIPQMADTGEIVRAAVLLPGVTIVALAPNLRGAEAAMAAGAQRISVPISVTMGHSRANLNRTPAEQTAEIGRMVAFLRGQTRRVELEVALSTAFGCSFDGVVAVDEVVRVAEGVAAAGADAISLADTVGYGHPADIRAKVRAVRAAIGPVMQGLHLHDTMGLGLANALAGLEEGVRKFDSALAGLGGCPFAPGASGNIVTEDLVFLLESQGFATGVDLAKLIAARAILTEGLPDEVLHGQVPRAGIPKTFRPAA
ncbi:MAG: hydroxymethylglutaryl-CoA lyase [Acetobacteraceae bacterium]|nr:hydroxymethylglutaryl-CoA lyase [Acetobacteraceae bacterium]